MTPEQVARGNTLPLSATVTAAIDALIAWFDDGAPAHDDHGNVRGGLRYGLIESAIATFIGSPGGATLGAMELDPADSVLARFPTLAGCLAAVAAVDDLLAERGFLNAIGWQQMVEAATELWTRATRFTH